MTIDLTDEELRLLVDATEGYPTLHKKLAAALAQSNQVNSVMAFVRGLNEAIERRKLEPPPPGFPRRCRDCGHGTNDPDGLCLGCRFT